MDQKKKILIPPHPLTNFETQKCYANEPRYNGVFLRDDLPNKKKVAYLLNLDEYAAGETHWIDLFLTGIEVIYFDTFGVERIPEDIKKFIGNKNIKGNIFRVESNNSIMCGYFCIEFIDSILANEKLTDFISLFSPYGFEKNDNII